MARPTSAEMGTIIPMPRRTTFHRNPEPQPSAPATACPRPKKSRWGWLKWVGATVAGSVIGFEASRRWAQYRRRDSDSEDGPQRNPALPGAPNVAMPSVVPFPMPMPMPMPGYGPPSMNGARTGAYYRGDDTYESTEARREKRAEARAKRQEKILAMMMGDDD